MNLEKKSTEDGNLFTLENCVESTRIRSFLALSRVATDDIVKTRLNEIPKSTCDNYFQDVIIPLWKEREKLIQYCGNYAQQLRKEVEIPQEQLKQIEYDLRMDPYALRDHKQIMDLKYYKLETIENWMQNESTVENIIRDQTVQAFNERCHYKDWLKMFFDSK